MRKLIEAERLGNWYLHLQAVSEKATIVGRLLCQVCQNLLKGALYRIRCGVNRLGDSGVKVVFCYPGGSAIVNPVG